MLNDVNNFENFVARRGLYRVWIRAHEGENAALIAVWIDPARKACEPQTKEGACNFTIASVALSGHDRQTAEEDRLQDREGVVLVKQLLSLTLSH